MRKFVFQIHLYVSLIIFPLVLIFGITGCLMAFEPEIDHLVHAKLFYVTPGTTKLSLAEITERVEQAFPNDTVRSYHMATSPNLSYQIHLKDKTVFINQYTGEIIGATAGPDGWNKFQGFIHQLHLTLALETEGGGTIMTWGGVCLLVILPSGLILWWRQKRLSIRWKAKSRLVWFDIHSLLGVTAFIFLLMLSITGVMIGFSEKVPNLFYNIAGGKPLVEDPAFTITPTAGATMITPDSAYTLAAAALPGAAPFNINIPKPNKPYQIACRYPEDLTPAGRSVVYLHPYTGKILYAEGSRTAPAGFRMEVANRAIHTGDIYGLPSKIIMSLASLTLTVLVLSGLVMWWKRRKKKAVALRR